MKQRPTFQLFALFLAFLLLVTVLPLSVFANDTLKETADALVPQSEKTQFFSEDEVLLLPTGDVSETVFPLEIPELRTENVKYFDNGDGTFEAVSYGVAVHRKDQNGEWQDIDNTLTLREKEVAVRYIAADERISFASSLSEDRALWTLSENGYTVSLALTDASLRPEIVADVKNHTSRSDQIASAEKNSDLRALLRIDNRTTILYRNVLPGADMEYTLSGNDVKENILIQKARENYDFSYRLSLSDLVPEMSESGTVLLLDAKTAETIYVIPAPKMTDAANGYSDAVSYRLTDLGDGDYSLIVSASKEWINAPERVFPVSIDPTLTSAVNWTYDTYISAKNGETKGQSRGDSPVMRLSKTEIPFIQSSVLPELPTGAVILGGKLIFAYDSDNGATEKATITAHRVTRDWSESSADWNSMSLNGADSSLGLTDAISTTDLETVADDPHWAECDISTAVRYWYNGTGCAESDNYGIALIRSSETGAVSLYTRNAYDGYTPFFTVSYSLISDVYSIRRTGSNYYLGTDARYWSYPLFQMEISTPPNNFDMRGYLFKFAYRPATDDYVIRSMQNSQFILYHDVSDHSVIVGAVTVNGAPATDGNLPSQYAWKIGTAPGGYENRIWCSYGGQNYFLFSSATGNGVITALTTSPADYSTEWDFCSYTGDPIRTTNSFYIVRRMITGETVDFDFIMLDDRVGVNGPVSYAVYDQNWNPSSLATVNPTTGVCTANGIGTFRLGVTYPSAPWIWGHDITVEKSLGGAYFIKNAERSLFLQVDDNDSPNYSNNGGIMEIWPYDGKNYQEWVFTYVGEGYYSIKSAANGYAITVPTGHETDDNVDLILTYYTGSDNQKWKIALTHGISYKIKAKSSNSYTDKDLVMDLETKGFFQSVKGLNVRQREYVDNSSYNDEWILFTFDRTRLMALNHSDGGPRNGYFSQTKYNFEREMLMTMPIISSVKTDYFSSCSINQMKGYLSDCGVFFIHTHGMKTGFEIGSEFITMYDVSDCDFSNLKLAVLLTCETAKDYDPIHITNNNPVNITEQLILCGVETVIGFKNETYVSDCNTFAEALSFKLISGRMSIEDAISDISYVYYLDPNFVNTIQIAGNSNLVLR